MDELNAEKISISAQDWYDLVKDGAKIPLYFKVNGHSMEPLIRYKKDVVKVVPLEREIVVGDILLFFKVTGEPTLHRVYKVKGNKVLMLGDNCDNPDAVIDKSAVLGIAQSMQKNGKTIVLDSEKARKKGKRRMKLFPMRRKFRILGYRTSSVKNKILEKTKTGDNNG